MRMKTCPRCDSSLDDEARYCVDCGPSNGGRRRGTRRVRTAAGPAGGRRVRGTGGGGGGDFGNAGNAESDGGGSGFVPTEQLTDREQLWRRGWLLRRLRDDCRRAHAGPAGRRLPLILGGIAILPPIPSSDRGAAREPAETRGDGRAVRGVRAARRRAARSLINTSSKIATRGTRATRSGSRWLPQPRAPDRRCCRSP